MAPVAAAAFESWSFDPWPIGVLLVTAGLYVRGWRQLRRQMPHRFGIWHLVAFQTGLGILLLAIASPLDAFGGLLLQIHMTQHLLLMMFVPPLIWLGLPAIPLLRGLPHVVSKGWLGPFLAWPTLHRFGSALGHPVMAWLSFVLATWVWHVPALYELALRSPFWHEVEHATFLATGLLFWWPVVQPWPSRPIWPRWTMIPYLLLADMQNTVFSGLFSFAERAIYPVYVTAPRLWGISALDDQAAAGAIMWVPGSIVFLLPVGLLIVELLSPRQVRPSELLAQPDASAGFAAGSVMSLLRARPATRATRLGQAGSRRSWDLLASPVVGAVFRWRYFRRTAQAVMLLLAVAIVADGLFGPQMNPMNLAGVLPWTHWRGLVVIALLIGGNFFCMVCPFMLPRELAKRLLPADWQWPRHLRSKWLAGGLLLVYLWAYEAYGLWDSPWWTAWIVVGYFAAAFTIDGLFRGASFCKYVCPIGQFHFVQSLASPLEVKVRRPDVCHTCTTHDCIRGNQQHRGCELELFQPEKVGNLDCTFCLDCIKACPHDNVGILATPPGQDLIRDPYRSSLRRLSRRPDVAAVALVLIFGAFVNAAGMVGPVVDWENRLVAWSGLGSLLPIVTGLLLLSLVIVPSLSVWLCGLVGRWLSGVRVSWKELTCRFVLALVPLGFSMWAAHFLFHLLTSAGTAVPVVQRLSTDLGVGLLGTPRWAMSLPGSTADWLLPLEMLLLDLGLLLTLYVAWRIATSYAERVAASLRLLMPWASMAVVLYAVGLWILFQPMQMRGMMIH